MLLSFLYNKPIINNVSAQNLGEISKIHINGKKIDYLLTSKNYRVATSKINKISDAIMYNDDGRNLPDFKFYSINNQIVTNDKGKIFGKLNDIIINKNFEISKIITDNKNLCNVEIISMSDDGLVFKRIPKSKSTSKITNINANTVTTTSIVTTICNYTFLIGRIIQKNICVGDNIIFRVGKKIDKKDIDIAQQYGKLIDLTLYSKFYNIENL